MAVQWCVYMVRSNDGTLYSGITNDLEKRIAQHNSENGGAKYTRSRRPVTLAYSESAGNRSDASRREHQIKRMPLSEKRKLLEGEMIP